MKKWIETLCRKTGYAVVPNWRLARFQEADFLRKLLRTYQVDLVVDVGANRGQYRDFLRAHGDYDGPIHSFEPNPDCASALEARAATDSEWTVSCCALGREESTMALNVMRSSAFSSFHSPDPTAVPELGMLNEVVERCEVSVRRLDTVPLQASSGAGAERIFLKLDTQGFDLEVLKGAEGILSRVVALQTEASVLPIYQQMPDIVETLETLKGRGFTLANAVPVTHDRSLRAVELDLMFISDTHARPRFDAGLSPGE